MIKKELLSLILGNEVGKCDVINDSKDKKSKYMEVDYKYDLKTYINLDTLGRLCKEWCLSKSYILESRMYTDTAFCSILGNKATLEANTELEAIIKATEWVAKEKGLLDEA